MEPQIEAPTSSSRDSLLLLAAAVLITGGMVAFYYFDGQLNVLVRVLILLASLGAGVAVAYQTRLGKELWGYVVGSRAELRKITWPTRQESIQFTLMIAVVVLIASLLMAGLDWVLLRLVKLVTGQG